MTYLTQTELETLKWMLEELRRGVEEEARAKTEILAAETEALALESLDERDNFAGSESREQVEGTLLDRQLDELRDVSSALRRIEDGSYGTCIDCGNPIGYGRLKAYPTAKRCTPCQAKQER
ncbi:MAG TPA: TraR/DksA C4-type zinc finger protein [Burkholderiaceae bacterium]